MHHRGFTLIELLLVIAVIAILIGIIAGLVMNSRSRAQNARLQTDLKQLRILSESYSNQTGSYAGWADCVQNGTSADCAIDDAALASSVETLTADINVRKPQEVTVQDSPDAVCMSVKLMDDVTFACTDSTGQFNTNLTSGCSATVCPGTP